MKHKSLTTTLLASSLALLLWGGIAVISPQDGQIPSNPVSGGDEVPGEGEVNPLADDEDVKLV